MYVQHLHQLLYTGLMLILNLCIYYNIIHMQNFQQILTEAAQLKQHQLKKQRKGYESLPQFLKSGLGYNKKYELIRKQDFNYQYRISNKVKDEGNQLFKQNKYQDAITKYQQALGMFRYIQSTSYQNMKDQNLSYHTYDSSKLRHALKQKYQTHMIALYLNISSCLAKQNKKQDAIISADQALKIKQTAKGHYRKAQAYLKYVNRDVNDYKLGILQLKQAYNIDKDPSILAQMHAAKENYEKQQQKSKSWFKFMLDKNKEQKGEEKPTTESHNKQKQSQKKQNPQKMQSPSKKLKKLQIDQLQKAAKTAADQQQKFQKVKQQLLVYTSFNQKQWLLLYQKDFIKRNGSKIYSILKIYNHDQLASEFRGMLAKCLEREQVYEKCKKACQECINWIKLSKIEQIKKYAQRYDLHVNWIQQNRKQSKQMPVQFNKQSRSSKPSIMRNSQDDKNCAQTVKGDIKQKKYSQKQRLKRLEQYQIQQEQLRKKHERQFKQQNEQSQAYNYYQRYKKKQENGEQKQDEQHDEKKYEYDQDKTEVPEQIRRLIQSDSTSFYQKINDDDCQADSSRNNDEQNIGYEQKQKNNEQTKKYIAVAIILFLLLVRFLWN